MPLNITVAGLGPIGASLGLALGTLDPQVLDVGRPVVTGWDRDRRVLADARGRLAVDQAQSDLVTAAREADVVIVTVPHDEIRDVFATIGRVLKAGAIVTDTASTKTQVLQWAAELLPTTVDFVGGHPLVSIENPGREALEGSIYCLVPLPRTGRVALDGVEALVRAVGCKPYYIDAGEHDAYVAAAAHLPLAVSIALMHTVSQGGGWREVQPIAGEALLRMTELAGADPGTNAEMLAANREALEGWLDRAATALMELRARLHDPAALRALLADAAEARDGWLHSNPNVRPGEDAFHGNTSELTATSGISSLFFGRRPPRDRGKRR